MHTELLPASAISARIQDTLVVFASQQPTGLLIK